MKNFSIRSIFIFTLLLTGATSITGCGYVEYCIREKETALHFKFIDKMNSNLKKQFAGTGSKKVKLRVPQQFNIVPYQKPEEGETDFDNRQPDYFSNDFELPGLVALWETPISVVVDGKSQQKIASLYALSNYDQWAVRSEKTKHAFDDPTKYLQTLVTGLTDALEVPMKEDYKGILKVPEKQEEIYVSVKTFDTIRFTPEMQIQGVPMEFELMMYQDGDIQAAMLLVIPTGNTEMMNNIRGRMKLSLYTFEAFKPNVAKSMPATGTPGGTPARPTGRPPGL